MGVNFTTATNNSCYIYKLSIGIVIILHLYLTYTKWLVIYISHLWDSILLYFSIFIVGVRIIMLLYLWDLFLICQIATFVLLWAFVLWNYYNSTHFKFSYFELLRFCTFRAFCNFKLISVFVHLYQWWVYQLKWRRRRHTAPLPPT